MNEQAKAILEALKGDLKGIVAQMAAEGMKGLQDKLTEVDGKIANFEEQLKAAGTRTEKGTIVKLRMFDNDSDNESAMKFLDWFSKMSSVGSKEAYIDFQKTYRGAKDVADPIMQEGVDEDGGYLVPEEFRPTVLRLIELYGVGRRGATIIPMASSTMRIPALTDSVEVFWLGENKTIDQTKATFHMVELVAKKLCCLIPLTGELLQDSSIPLANLLANLLAEAVAAEEDRVIFTGSTIAGDPFNGILNVAGTVVITMEVGETAFTDLNYDHLIKLPSRLPKSARNGSSFYMHSTILELVSFLKDKEDRYIWTAPQGERPGRIAGYPYDEVDQMPDITETAADTPFVIFGNLKNVYLGDRLRMSIRTSEDAGFKDFVTFLRMIQREGIVVALPGAFSILKTHA